MTIYGWDIGGAHLKMARMDAEGRLLNVAQAACPLWLGLDQLDRALIALMQNHPASPKDRHILTMTGELTDYFENRAEGVAGILTHFRQRLPENHLLVFAGPRGFLDSQTLKADDWQWIASANWLASGLWAAKKLGEGLFFDIGSTTSDLLLFSGQKTLNQGYSDHERMVQDELVYTGVLRTPVMTLTNRAPILGHWTHPMAELFATTADIYRITGELREETDQYPAADQGPKTRKASERRLGRQFGVDADTLADGLIEQLAHYLRDCQRQRLENALACQRSRGLLSKAAPLIGAGIGRFLVKEMAEHSGHSFLDFKDLFEWASNDSHFDAADCGPAAAVAALSLS